MKKQVAVLVGAGSIGQAIIRRVSAGKHIVLADYSEENAKRAAKTLEDAGFECSTIKCDLGSKEDILKLVEFAMLLACHPHKLPLKKYCALTSMVQAYCWRSLAR